MEITIGRSEETPKAVISIYELRVGRDLLSRFPVYGGVRCIGPGVVEHCAFSRSGCSDKALCKCSVSGVQEVASSYSLQCCYIGPGVVEHCAFSRSGCSDKAPCKCSVCRSGSSVELFTSVLLYRSGRLSRSGSNVLGLLDFTSVAPICLCLFQPRHCAVARSAPVFSRVRLCCSFGQGIVRLHDRQHLFSRLCGCTTAVSLGHLDRSIS